MRRGFIAALSFATLTAFAIAADAQPSPPRRPIPRPPVKPEPNAPSSSSSATGSSFVRSHVGTDYAIKLIRSSDLDERIRGIQRFAAIGTSDAITQLVQQIESFPPLKGDSRALVELARALSRFTDQERARAGLILVVNAPSQSLTGALPRPRGTDALSLEEGDPIARAELARQMAAIALARSSRSTAPHVRAARAARMRPSSRSRCSLRRIRASSARRARRCRPTPCACSAASAICARSMSCTPRRVRATSASAARRSSPSPSSETNAPSA